MERTWLLIANAARARVLQQDEPTHGLTVLRSLAHEASRSRASELGDDKAGRELSDRSFGGAAFESGINLQRKEHQQFARELAQVLEEGAQQHRYDAVHVFASSPFLGHLKQALRPATCRLLAGLHDVDLTAVGVVELPARIDHAMTFRGRHAIPQASGKQAKAP